MYLGRSPGGRLVALKVIRDEITEHPEALVRFRREVETARAVRSAYTANLIDASLDEAPYWLATEYVQGPTLSSAVAERGPLPAETCRGLFAALAEGLAAVHACGVTHRDLKPQNVILSQRGPQLIDFGIARGAEQTAVTEDGAAGPGTPGFTAPEVLMRNEVGPAADVFALGATVAYAATGRPPFGTGPAASVGYRAVYEPIDLAGVEEGLAGLVQACVAKDPAARPSLAQVIERCAVSGALVGDVHYAALAGTGAVPQPAAAPAPGGAPVPAVPAAAPPGRAVGDTGPTASPVDGSAKGGGASSEPPKRIEQTAPSVTYWNADPHDEWAGGRCNIPSEEVNQHFQFSVPRDAAEIASGKVKIGMRLKPDGARPGERYYATAVVKPPHDQSVAEAEESGMGLIENRALGHTSELVDLNAEGDAQDRPWVEFTYPDDFGTDAQGGSSSDARPLRDDPGDWTVMFMHVTSPKDYRTVVCTGFTVPE